MYSRGYPVTMNTPENTEFAAEVAKAVSGHVDADTAPLMGAEDFSFMLLERPGAYIFVGNGDTAMVHHPAYNFDDNVIPFGSSWYAGMVESRMPGTGGRESPPQAVPTHPPDRFGGLLKVSIWDQLKAA